MEKKYSEDNSSIYILSNEWEGFDEKMYDLLDNEELDDAKFIEFDAAVAQHFGYKYCAIFHINDDSGIFACPKCGSNNTEVCGQTGGDDPIFNHFCKDCKYQWEIHKGKIVEYDWDNFYTPIDNPITPENEDKFETYGEDFEYVKSYDKNHVWTVCDGDDGDLTICKGIHYVNRIYYLITKESHEDDYDKYNY